MSVRGETTDNRICRGARAALLDGMSQKDAEDEAGKWIGAFKLGRDLSGRVIDLSSADLPFTGTFRRMVLQAIRAKLERRGAKEITLPPL